MTDKLDMVYDLVREQNKKLDKLIECNTIIKVKQENHEQRIKMGEKITVSHIENKDKHFNPYYNETFRQKIYRKKDEILVGSGGGGLIGLIIILLDKVI